MRTKSSFLMSMVLTCSLIITSCRTGTDSTGGESTQISPPETATTQSMSSTASTTNHITRSLIKVLPDLPSFFWWSADSSKLYYELDGVREFDVITGVANETQAVQPETVRCPYLPDIYNNMLLFQQECSPSQKKIIYYTLQGTSLEAPSPVPAPSNCNSGECLTGYDEGILVDMWVWENGEANKVGQLISCIKNHLWAQDEQSLIAIGYDKSDRPMSPTCDNTFYAWWIDLANHRITPLLSKADHSSNTFVHAYSLDGNFLLYTEDRKLYLLDVQTQEETAGHMSREVNNAWWVSEHKVLILFYLQTGGYNMGWGVLDLESGKFTELLNESNTIGEYILGNPTVSPDKKWLAFTARYPSRESYGFWVISLEMP